VSAIIDFTEAVYDLELSNEDWLPTVLKRLGKRKSARPRRSSAMRRSRWIVRVASCVKTIREFQALH
jgi:hypothetical protein